MISGAIDAAQPHFRLFDFQAMHFAQLQQLLARLFLGQLLHFAAELRLAEPQRRLLALNFGRAHGLDVLHRVGDRDGRRLAGAARARRGHLLLGRRCDQVVAVGAFDQLNVLVAKGGGRLRRIRDVRCVDMEK